MNTKKFYFILIITGLLAVLAFGQKPNAPASVKASQLNPAFSSLQSLNVFFVEPVLEEDVEPIIWKKIEGRVKQRLIDSHPQLAKLVRKKQTRGNSEVAQLQTVTETLNPEGGNPILFRIETSLVVELVINKKRDEYLEAKVWSLCDTIRVASQADVPRAISNLAVKHADTFAGAWLLANPMYKKSPKKSAKPLAESEPVEAKYLASKNSRIFHLAPCKVTNRIKPQNLLKYETRKQAVKDGKRPCKRCKP